MSKYVTVSCSGCFSAGEYGGQEIFYPWDAKAQCRVGSGCHECGYTGKRRTMYMGERDLIGCLAEVAP